MLPANLKDLWLKRLKEWEKELETNEHGLQAIAQRCVDVLREEIHFYWGEDNEDQC